MSRLGCHANIAAVLPTVSPMDGCEHTGQQSTLLPVLCPGPCAARSKRPYPAAKHTTDSRKLGATWIMGHSVVVSAATAVQLGWNMSPATPAPCLRTPY